jgi:ethanolamine kinase
LVVDPVYNALLTPWGSTEETKSHKLLAERGLAPPLLARFQNGLLYRFIRGRVCSPEDLTKEPVWRGVARRLAEWHALVPAGQIQGDALLSPENDQMQLPLSRESHPMKNAASNEEINSITPGKATPNLWTILQKWIFALPTDSEAEKLRQKTLQKELERTVKELGDSCTLGKDGVWSVLPISGNVC